MSISTIRSHIMRTANKLVKQGFTRSAAMVKAWALSRIGTIRTKVSGVTFGRRQEALEHLEAYSPADISVRLLRDKQNAHDSNAVAVIVNVRNKGSYHIGYVPKALATMIAPLMDVGATVGSCFAGITGGFSEGVSRGLNIGIAFA